MKKTYKVTVLTGTNYHLDVVASSPEEAIEKAEWLYNTHDDFLEVADEGETDHTTEVD